MRTAIITGLGAAALILTACSDGAEKLTASNSSGSSSTSGDTAATGDVAVSIKDFLFKDATVTVAPGTKITWTNEDSAVHSVVSSEKGVFASPPSMEQNATFTFTADKAGTIDYICGIHNYMVGKIVVS